MSQVSQMEVAAPGVEYFSAQRAAQGKVSQATLQNFVFNGAVPVNGFFMLIRGVDNLVGSMIRLKNVSLNVWDRATTNKIECASYVTAGYLVGTPAGGAATLDLCDQPATPKYANTVVDVVPVTSALAFAGTGQTIFVPNLSVVENPLPDFLVRSTIPVGCAFGININPYRPAGMPAGLDIMVSCMFLVDDMT